MLLRSSVQRRDSETDRTGRKGSRRKCAHPVDAGAAAHARARKRGDDGGYVEDQQRDLRILAQIAIDEATDAGVGKIEFNMDEISETLGRPMTPHLFEIAMSAHYGRMVMVDDNTVVLFGNMDDALQYE